MRCSALVMALAIIISGGAVLHEKNSVDTADEIAQRAINERDEAQKQLSEALREICIANDIKRAYRGILLDEGHNATDVDVEAVRRIGDAVR